MARGINNVLLIGSLARNPELRYAPSGTAILSFTLAGDSRVIGNDGVERIIPWYQRATLIGKSAESAADQLKAGDAVLAEGSLEYRAWDNEEGQRRSKTEVKVSRLEPLRAGGRSEALVKDSVGGLRLTNAVNHVTLLGNLTRDAETRVTPNGHSVTSLSLAVTESWKDAQNEWQERTHFLDVTLWRELSDAAEGLPKGSPVLVTGRVTTDSWTDKDGNKRSSVKVEADRLELLARNAKATQEGSTATAPAAQKRSGGKAIQRSAPRVRGNAPAMAADAEEMPF